MMVERVENVNEVWIDTDRQYTIPEIKQVGSGEY